MRKLFFILLFLFLVLLCSCSKEPELVIKPLSPLPQSIALPKLEQTPEPEPETVEPEIPEHLSELSGLGISEEEAALRPVAVMINNDKRSLPQSGISKADVIFECEAEGGTTRMMAVFKTIENVGVIGTVRSARDYFIDFAQIFDALYIHAGGSPTAYEHIKERKINNLDGVNMYLPDCFRRDPERLKTSSLEHTLVTYGDKLYQKINEFGYRTVLKDSYEPSLYFASEPYVPEGESAEYIKIPRAFPSEFAFDAENGVYRHIQYDTVQTDKETETELGFENVIILYVSQYPLNDDKNRIAVNFTGSGKGYFISHGKYVPITWQRDSRDGGVMLYDGMGQTVELCPGKTFISIANTFYYTKTEIR